MPSILFIVYPDLRNCEFSTLISMSDALLPIVVFNSFGLFMVYILLPTLYV